MRLQQQCLNHRARFVACWWINPRNLAQMACASLEHMHTVPSQQAFDTIDASGAASPAAPSSTYAQAGGRSYSQGQGAYSQGPAASTAHTAPSSSQPPGFFPAAPPSHIWAAPPSPSPELVRGQLSGMVLAGEAWLFSYAAWSLAAAACGAALVRLSGV